MTNSAFDVPEAKAFPSLIARDERQFEAIADSLRQQVDVRESRLAELRRSRAALDRDLDIHRLTAQLRVLRRFGLDLCLGRMVVADDADPVYIGRVGLTGEGGTRLLVDWRTPAAEPFFAATHASPMGLASRRRYRWTRGRITDFWDEVFTSEGLETVAALDDQSAFIASLGSSRSPRMRDVLSTIQSDQDAIIRAGSRGALVVDGGPGTGKTVVALHRAAYLLYSDARISQGGGVLFIGPSRGYLSYVDDVLPSLGEESVQISTLRDLVVEGAVLEGADVESADVEAESSREVATLKASSELLAAVEAAVAYYERPPSKTLMVETPWADIRITPHEWADAFGAADAGATHNEARGEVWEALLEIAANQFDEDEVPPRLLRRTLEQSEELSRTFARTWPLLDPAGVLADLWSVPAYLRRCAPKLTEAQVGMLQRAHPRAWTLSDLPLLDAARHRIGDPDAARRDRARAAELQHTREQMDDVIADLIASDDSEMQVMSMLRRPDARNSLDDDSALPSAHPDLLAGPFAHIIVDEAQELTDAEWAMLLRRCPSRSFTIVGDRAQARNGFPESWQDRLTRVGLPNSSVASLSVNYRTPSEVMAVAEPAIRAVVPDANVPVSIRDSGIPVTWAKREELDGFVETWLADHDGLACVIGLPYPSSTRVRSLTPAQSKGLEFDLVVIVGEIENAVDRYVAMTRATQQLVIVT